MAVRIVTGAQHMADLVQHHRRQVAHREAIGDDVGEAAAAAAVMSESTIARASSARPEAISTVTSRVRRTGNPRSYGGYTGCCPALSLIESGQLRGNGGHSLPRLTREAGQGMATRSDE